MASDDGFLDLRQKELGGMYRNACREFEQLTGGLPVQEAHSKLWFFAARCENPECGEIHVQACAGVGASEVCREPAAQRVLRNVLILESLLAWTDGVIEALETDADGPMSVH